ncbi:MAG: DNA polymerase III subunit delta [Chloracidobacterium sp.]|nr:DNA polymerase III subunit delta [Chloracidobacterium sp.]
MVFSREDLRNQLKRREIKPIYLLFGPETHLRDSAVKTITDFAFAEGDLRDFNETSFSLNTEDNLQRAISAAEQLPMMSTRRVVRVTDVRISASGIRDTITEDHEPILSAYLSNPSQHSVVIFVADELNGVRKMGKFLREKTTAVEFSFLDDGQLTKLAREKITEAGAEIDDAALRYLIGLVGQDVRRLTNEINKLATAVLPGKTITLELIESLVPNSRELSNFDLTDHLVAGRRTQALAVLKKILDDGGEPLALLGLISYNYRRLLIVKEMMSRGADRREVANAAKLRYNDQEPFLTAARRAEMGSLTRAIKLLAKTDLAIKTSTGGSGPVGARLQIEMLVCELALI